MLSSSWIANVLGDFLYALSQAHGIQLAVQKMIMDSALPESLQIKINILI